MSGEGDSDDGGGLVVLLHHKGTGRYAALTQDHMDHINDSVTNPDLKAKLAAMLKKPSE